MPKEQINRRIFVKRAAAATTLAVASGTIYCVLRDDGVSLADGVVPGYKRQPAQGEKRFIIGRGSDPSAVTTMVLNALGDKGIGEIVAKGESVLIKPNVGWDSSPRMAANTNPDVVREVARLCLDAGASRVVVSDNSCSDPDRCFDRSGIRKALKELDVEIVAPGETDFVPVDMRGKVVRQQWKVLRAFLECDRVINVPVAKHHSAARLTMGMKNWYGILSSSPSRGKLHQKMDEGIVDLARFALPDLTVLDATRVIFRNGPRGDSIANTRELNTVAVSNDPVAIDAFGAELMADLTKTRPEEVGYIALAEAEGLGTSDYRSLEPVELEV